METPMNPWLLTAGLAAILLDLIHVTLGERDVHRRMVAADWDREAKAIGSVVWHMATAVMAFGGIALIAAAFLPDHRTALAILPILLFLSTTGLFLGYGLTRLGSPWRLPQGFAFGGIAALAITGLLS
jgi:hypothetical protein